MFKRSLFEDSFNGKVLKSSLKVSLLSSKMVPQKKHKEKTLTRSFLTEAAKMVLTIQNPVRAHAHTKTQTRTILMKI